jgi:paraquat-inducible protein A
LQQHLIVCEHCDAVHRWRALAPAEVARCSRCAAVLARGHRLGVPSLLALTIAALFVLLIANLTPIVEIGMRGQRTMATLPEAIAITWSLGEPLAAVAAALTAIVAPAALILLRLAVLVPLARGRKARHFSWCMRALREAWQWSMVEVMMVAAAVAIVRMAGLAQAVPGPGVFAFGALAVLLAALESGGLKHLWLEAA